MNDQEENNLNEFTDEWLKDADPAAQIDAEAAAVIRASKDEVSQAEGDYVQAHADLESSEK